MHRLPPFLVAVLAALAALAAPAAAHPGDVLPDLDQVVPSGLQVSTLKVGPHRIFRLGFASASANVGPAPLTLHGHRPNRRQTTMAADQLVTQTVGSPRLIPGVGKMSFIVHPDHRHWHLLGFERYELRRPGSDKPSVRHDRKTGFCLGDRYAIPQAPGLPNFSATPLQGDTCGLGRPDLLGLFVGISTGWADRYEAQIEGQYIDITDAPSRKYVLVHTVNPDRRIAESDYSNNSSSILFSLSWLNGRHRLPRVSFLSRLAHSSSGLVLCGFPGTMCPTTRSGTGCAVLGRDDQGNSVARRGRKARDLPRRRLSYRLEI
jgi:hypothetical protein